MFPLSSNSTSAQKSSSSMASRAEPMPLTPKSIAEGIFEEMRAHGLRDKDIIAVSSQILSLLTDDIKVRLSESKTSIV